MTEAATVTGSEGTPSSATTTTTSTGDWFESLTPELKVEKSLQSFKGKPITDVVKSYVEAQKMIGGSIRLPKPDAPEEEKAKFYQDIYGKLGRPDTVDGYDAKRPELPDGTPWDETSQKAFLDLAHKQGLSKSQAQSLLDWYGGTLANGMKAQQEQYALAERQLKQEWGAQYEHKLALAQQAAGEIGGKDFVDLLESKGIANNPIVLRTLAAYGETLAESKIITGDIPGQPGPSEATQKLQAIYANRDHPYHKGDQKAVEEVLRLTQIEQGAAGRKVAVTFG